MAQACCALHFVLRPPDTGATELLSYQAGAKPLYLQYIYTCICWIFHAFLCVCGNSIAACWLWFWRLGRLLASTEFRKLGITVYFTKGTYWYSLVNVRITIITRSCEQSQLSVTRDSPVVCLTFWCHWWLPDVHTSWTTVLMHPGVCPPMLAPEALGWESEEHHSKQTSMPFIAFSSTNSSLYLPPQIYWYHLISRTVRNHCII